MIPGFITPKEGDKDTWPPEGWRGKAIFTTKAGKKVVYHECTEMQFREYAKMKAYSSFQWLDETPCTEQVRELLEWKKTVTEYLQNIADKNDISVDFSDSQYNGDLDVPMDIIGFIDHLGNLAGLEV